MENNQSCLFSSLFLLYFIRKILERKTCLVFHMLLLLYIFQVFVEKLRGHIFGFSKTRYHIYWIVMKFFMFHWQWLMMTGGTLSNRDVIKIAVQAQPLCKLISTLACCMLPVKYCWSNTIETYTEALDGTLWSHPSCCSVTTNSRILHHYTGRSPGIIVSGFGCGIVFYSITWVIRIAGTSKRHHYTYVWF